MAISKGVHRIDTWMLQEMPWHKEVKRQSSKLSIAGRNSVAILSVRIHCTAIKILSYAVQNVSKHRFQSLEHHITQKLF